MTTAVMPWNSLIDIPMQQGSACLLRRKWNNAGPYRKEHQLSSRLKIKIRENKEGRERTLLFGMLPPSWERMIDRDRFIYPHEYFLKFPISPGQDFKSRGFTLNFSTYTYKDFDEIALVKGYLKNRSMAFNGPFLCWFGMGAGICH